MNRFIRALALFVAAGFLSALGFAQERGEKLEHQTIFSRQEMEKMWEEFSRDKAWMVVMKEVREKGFERNHEEKAAWGFKGVQVGPKETRSEVLICLFDIQGKNSKDKGTLVWAQKGSQRYKAYVVIPAGKDLAQSNEWFVDQNMKIQKAHSWGRCFLRELKLFCGPTCISSMVPCLVAAGATVTAAGIGGVTSPAVFAGCVAAICGTCVGLVAIGCAFA